MKSLSFRLVRFSTRHSSGLLMLFSLRQFCSATLLFTALMANAAELEPGLVGEFFTIDNPSTFPTIAADRQPTLVRVEPRIAFDEVNEGDFYGTRLTTNFYARWRGVLKIAAPGLYKFALDSDDGSRLSIDGKVVVNEEEVAAMKSESSNTVSADDDDVVKRIKELLENYVKPAVEMDGGAIQFKSYEDGRVNLMLQGSCSGCPSSMITLKAGIEGMMKRMIPEVKEVVAEAE